MINNTLEASEKRAKENFGIKNTSYPGIIDRFFSLFTGKDTTNNKSVAGESAPIDPTQGCTVTKGYANQTSASPLVPSAHSLDSGILSDLNVTHYLPRIGNSLNP